MAAPAAVAGAMFRHRRQQVQQERENAILQRHLLRERTIRYFEMLSADGKWLLETQVGKVLTMVMEKHGFELEPDAVHMVIDTAIKSQGIAGLNPPVQGALAKHHLVQAVDKYGEYMKKKKSIDAIFKKMGKDSNYLTKKGLWKALQAYERKANRAKGGFVVTLFVQEKDASWIMEKLVGTHDGRINRTEYLPAIALWEELARMKLNESSSCVIL